MKNILSILLAITILGTMVPFALSVSATEDTTSATDSLVTTAATTEFTQNTTPSSTNGTNPTQGVTAPKAVSSFNVTNVTVSSISLKWSVSSDATKYIIYRASENSKNKVGSYSEYKTIKNKSTTKFKDSKLKEGKVYKYKIYACREKNGVTARSAAKTVSAMTKLNTLSKVKVTAKSNTSISIAWSKNSKATRYLVYRTAEKANGTFKSYKPYKELKKSKTSFTDINLKSGKIYKYRVYARRIKGSLTGTSVGKSTKAVTKLAPTSEIKSKKATTSKISISWKKITRANKYELYRKSSSSGYTKILETTATSYTDNNVTSGLTYKYKVRGVRIIGGKKYYGVFKALKTSAAVTGVKGLNVKSYLRRGLFTWSSVTGASGYDIYVKKSNGSYKYKDTVRVPSYLTGKLKTGKTYTFAIKAYKTINGKKSYGKTRKASVNIVDTAFGKTASGTYVEICTETQTMYMYVNNKLYVTTPVVTGMYNSQDTTHGYHYVISRKSPARLRGSANGHSWDVGVTYWLGFTSDGQGIHDSTWRTSGYGGTIYKGDGSNGCVNTPYSAASKIYQKSYMGMPVIVY